MHPNVRFALDAGNIVYTLHLHTSFNRPINTPIDFAQALGYPIQRITKSVFIRSVDKQKYAMAVCSVDRKLNFPLLATHLACNKVEVASKDELHQWVGYAPTGVTPIGLQVHNLPIFMDRSLLHLPTVLTGAGVPAQEIELAPADFQKLTNAVLLDITL